MENIERITDKDKVYAIVLRREFNSEGANFFTPSEFSQQLGMLIHKKGKIVQRHRHKLVKREIFRTQEVLVLLEGTIKVDLYDDKIRLLKSVTLSSGDTILLAQGGHRVEVLEDSKILEVKQGPYAGFDEKEYF
jgi:hypothetical protein